MSVDSASFSLFPSPNCPSFPERRGHHGTVSQIAADAVQVFRINDLPRDTTIIVGSLDRGGRNHQVRIASGNAARSAPLQNADAVTYSYTGESAAGLLNEPFSRHTFFPSAEVPCPPAQIRLRRISAELTVPASELPEIRHFLVPIPGDAAARVRVAEARLTAATDRVAVYNADSFPAVSEFVAEHRAQDAGRLIAEFLDPELLDTVRSLIGAVEDVDRNSRLTVVLTDLRTACAQHAAGVPVIACVRSSDLLTPDAPFSGDIIYLDRTFALNAASHKSELRAILSHELAHAAVSSALLRHRISKAGTCSATDDQTPCDGTVNPRDELPDWLNEAIAHTVEYCLVPESENLARRFDAFRSAPEQSPIFAADPSMPHSLRRGGCRAAAVSFLNHSNPDPDNPHLCLRTLLQFEMSLEQRLQMLQCESFPEAFRRWCLMNAALQIQRRGESLSGFSSGSATSRRVLMHQPPMERDLESSAETTILLRGTAATCYRTASDCHEVVITASSSAQLQVSVLTLSSKPQDRLPTVTRPSQFQRFAGP